MALCNSVEPGGGGGGVQENVRSLGGRKHPVNVGTQVTSVNLEKPAGAYVLSGPQKLMSKKEEKNLVTWGNAECIGGDQGGNLKFEKAQKIYK